MRLWAGSREGRLRAALAGSLLPVALAFAVFMAAAPVTGQNPAADFADTKFCGSIRSW